MTRPSPDWANLFNRLGVPPSRILMGPPRIATTQQLLEVLGHRNLLCELVDGALIERPSSMTASRLANHLATRVVLQVRRHDLGVVTSANGPIEILNGLVRLPDVAFTTWERFRARIRPDHPISHFAPDFIAEVVHPTNQIGERIVRREQYFRATVRLVWEVDIPSRTVSVYTSPTHKRTLTVGDTLDGAPVLPGFTLPLADLFAELDRHG